MKRLLALLISAWTAQAACVPPPNTYDWEAQLWQTNILANSGTLSALSYRTGTTFMQQVKWWGIRPLLGRVNLYLGGETNAMLCPIIIDWRGADPDINDDLISFVSGDYSEATGLTGDTTAKRLRPSKGTGLNLSAFADISDLHLATYVRTASTEASYTMGAAYAGGATVGLPVRYSGTSYLEISSPANQVGVADGSGTGFYVATKVAANDRVLYRNGSSILTSSATDSATLSSVAPMVHAFNSAGTVTAWTSRTLSYYAFGKGIPASRIAAYNIAVQNVQQALGRKMP